MKIKKKSFCLKTVAVLAAILGLITFCVTPLAARSEYRCEKVNAIFISASGQCRLRIVRVAAGL
jgi:hypothetical protein